MSGRGGYPLGHHDKTRKVRGQKLGVCRSQCSQVRNQQDGGHTLHPKYEAMGQEEKKTHPGRGPINLLRKRGHEMAGGVAGRGPIPGGKPTQVHKPRETGRCQDPEAGQKIRRFPYFGKEPTNGYYPGYAPIRLRTDLVGQRGGGGGAAKPWRKIFRWS